MRIVGGKWGGRRLAAAPERLFRPTQERVREALFASLGERVVGRQVLDLYAGSGALGLEALSRGAAAAVFVENSPGALAVLRRNIAGLGAQRLCRVMAGDAVGCVEKAAASLGRITLLLADPPYGDQALLLAEGLAKAGPAIWGPGAIQVLECAEKDPLGPPPPGWLRWPSRRYGDTRLVIDEREREHGGSQ